ncbi:MAG: integrase core domain-containing protein [Acetobacteraceae bacterium]|nr:integrase core domain-containing protein [Acetobacteraceae bacterium]
MRRLVEPGQYACGDYIARLQQARIQPSMSRPGCPWDNAMAESFMRTLKHEEVDGQSYRDLADVCARIGLFLEEVYNRQRLHSALAYRPPAVFEAAAAGGAMKRSAIGPGTDEAPTSPSVAPCSPPSRTLRAASGGGLRLPVTCGQALTAAPLGTGEVAGRDEETALVNRTKKHHEQSETGQAVRMAVP